MLPTIRKAAVLAAIPVTLTLGIAAPASASSAGAQELAGYTYMLPDYQNQSNTLQTGQTSCTALNVATPLSARNYHPTSTIRLYGFFGNCSGTPLATLPPGSGIPLLPAGVWYYTST